MAATDIKLSVRHVDPLLTGLQEFSLGQVATHEFGHTGLLYHPGKNDKNNTSTDERAHDIRNRSGELGVKNAMRTRDEADKSNVEITKGQMDRMYKMHRPPSRLNKKKKHVYRPRPFAVRSDD